VKGEYSKSNNKSCANKNLADLLTKDLSRSAFREPQSTWVYGKIYDPWILRVQNEYKFLFQNEKVYGGR
jgi:hypothetical protein